MAYANVAIAPPSPHPLFVLDERLVQELTDTLCDTIRKALDDYLAPANEPPIIEPPAIEPPVIEPPANKSNFYGVDYSPVNEPPSIQPDVPVYSIQPRLPSSCRLLYVQTAPLLLSYAPCAPDIYTVLFRSLVNSLRLASLVDFRDTG